MAKSLLIVGSVALDSIKTPFGEKERILGGSATHSSTSASFYSPVNLVGVVGEDFPLEAMDFFRSKNIDLTGLQQVPGKTFHWKGFYEYDMNQAHTLETQLNVFSQFSPHIPPSYQESEYVFLANIDPELQQKVLSQIKKPKLVIMDTMNYWIQSKPEALKTTMSQVDYVLLNESEARQFANTPNLMKAAREILALGPKAVIIKKGEHGALMFTHAGAFSAPGFPLEEIKDPTGAGDAFAGGFIGYLSRSEDLSDENVRKAIIIGSVMASFIVEDFSLDRLKTLTLAEIISRYEEFRKLSAFEPTSPLVWLR